MSSDDLPLYMSLPTTHATIKNAPPTIDNPTVNPTNNQLSPLATPRPAAALGLLVVEAL